MALSSSDFASSFRTFIAIWVKSSEVSKLLGVFKFLSFLQILCPKAGTFQSPPWNLVKTLARFMP